MTKEEIIHRLQYARHRIDNITYAPDVLKAIDIAIETVGNTDADTISRQAAIDAAIDAADDWDGGYSLSRADMIERAINNLPPAQPERIKARWLPIGMADAVGGESAMWGDEIAYHACDNCWQQALEKDGEEVLSDFCPNCGAEMEVTT